eukprot:2848534-Amphidinium_carterae.1
MRKDYSRTTSCSNCTKELVQLVVIDVAVKHDVLKFEGVLVDVDVVEQDVLCNEVHELVDADVVED